MRTFPSKKDLWLGIVIWLSMGFGLAASIISGSLFTIIIMLALTALVIWIWFFTFYAITEENLIIKSGPFSRKIPLNEIEGIKKSKSPLAAPALSLDRWEIRYKKRISLISPQNGEEFIELLKEKTNL